VFGAHGGNFPKTILRLAQERSVLTIVDDQHGCPTPAEAIAAALLYLAGTIREKGEAFSWGTYHFAGGPPTTWFDLARVVVGLGEGIGLIASPPEVKPIPTSDYPTPAPRPANSVLDCSKWRATFDHPLPDWRNGLTTMLREIATGGTPLHLPRKPTHD
jgi:dTDP-4-dehydrorhamnose reductase